MNMNCLFIVLSQSQKTQKTNALFWVTFIYPFSSDASQKPPAALLRLGKRPFVRVKPRKNPPQGLAGLNPPNPHREPMHRPPPKDRQAPKSKPDIKNEALNFFSLGPRPIEDLRGRLFPPTRGESQSRKFRYFGIEMRLEDAGSGPRALRRRLATSQGRAKSKFRLQLFWGF